MANEGDIWGPLYLQAAEKLKKQLYYTCVSLQNEVLMILSAWIFVFASSLRNITFRAWKYASMLKKLQPTKEEPSQWLKMMESLWFLKGDYFLNS